MQEAVGRVVVLFPVAGEAFLARKEVEDAQHSLALVVRRDLVLI